MKERHKGVEQHGGRGELGGTRQGPTRLAAGRARVVGGIEVRMKQKVEQAGRQADRQRCGCMRVCDPLRVQHQACPVMSCHVTINHTSATGLLRSFSSSRLLKSTLSILRPASALAAATRWASRSTLVSLGSTGGSSSGGGQHRRRQQRRRAASEAGLSSAGRAGAYGGREGGASSSVGAFPGALQE